MNKSMLGQALELKKRLAREIVRMYHGADAASRAQTHFETVFCRKGQPDDMPCMKLDSPCRLIDILCDAGLVSSNAEARRLVRQGAVKIGDAAIYDENMEIAPGREIVIKVGKRRFLRII